MVLIPERTIDSLLAFELISALPTSIIWSPQAVAIKNTPNQAGTPDHFIRTANWRFIFECKTIHESGPAANKKWVVQVPLDQLRRYVKRTTEPFIYVLPADPAVRAAPWRRGCQSDPDDQGMCIACSNPNASQGPIYRRRWDAQHSPISGAPEKERLQPWFNHWAWCVDDKSLLNYIQANQAQLVARKASGDVALLDADDVKLARIPNAHRLCHFLDWAAGDAPKPVSPAKPGDSGPDVGGAPGADGGGDDRSGSAGSNSSDSGDGRRSDREAVEGRRRDDSVDDSTESYSQPRFENEVFASWSIRAEALSEFSTFDIRGAIENGDGLTGIAY